MRTFDGWRWMLNTCEPRSGKSLERAVMRYFCLYPMWIAMLKTLPDWAMNALNVRPRHAYLTWESRHKAEITKEGLDPKKFSTHNAAEVKLLKKTKMCLREDGLGLPIELVRKFVAHSLDLDPTARGDTKWNWHAFANCWQPLQQLDESIKGHGQLFCRCLYIYTSHARGV